MLLLVALPPLHDPGGAYYPAVLLPSTLVFGLLLYTASGRLDLLPSLLCLAVALTGVALVLARLWNPASWGGSSGSYELVAWRIGLSVGLVAAAACLWSLGRLSRIRVLFLSELRAKAERAEADRARERQDAARAERDRISREMHDVVSHSLAVMVSQAEGGRLTDPDSPGAGVFATIAGVGREALRDMRGLLGVLRADGGTTPQPGLGDLSDLLDQVRDAGVRLAVQEVGDARSLRPAVDLIAYCVIQEGLTNVIKHGGDGHRRHDAGMAPGQTAHHHHERRRRAARRRGRRRADRDARTSQHGGRHPGGRQTPRRRVRTVGHPAL
jgi:signal transduction histidine kinase